MMKHISCAVIGWMLAGPTLPAEAGQTSRTEMLKQSNIVFVGTVAKPGAVSFPGVPASARTMVVRVDEVIEKPPAVSMPRGANVTVEVKNPSLFREGVQATFYTQSWIFGAGLALREVGHELMAAQQPTGPATPRERVVQTREALNEAELRARVQAADIVVVGQVQEVRAPSVNARGTGEPPQAREHDPEWREAVIRVESAIKGVQANQDVVVKFPASRDIAWHQAPKFQQGQSGTFILKRDQASGVPRAMLAGRQVNTYTALTAGDVLPADAAARIRALIR